MFDTVYIDKTEYDPSFNTGDFNIKENRLRPFIYLIADTVVEAWDFGEIKDKGLCADGLYTIRSSGSTHITHFEGAGYKCGPILFSPSNKIKALNFQEHGLIAKNAVLLLAAAGLELSIPKFTFDTSKLSELNKIKTKLGEERNSYIISITKIADEAFDRLSSGVYEDTADWALNEAYLKLNPIIRKFEKAMSNLDKSLLNRISFGIVKEGVPKIGSSLYKDGFKGATQEAISLALKILSSNLVKSIEERKCPEAVYGYKLNEIIYP